MSWIRIRSVHNGVPKEWVYAAGKKIKQSEKPKVYKAAPRSLKKTNQYGRFRYAEKQYGKLISESHPSLEILKTPLRIRIANNDWIYSTYTKIDGACPAIRIRSGYGDKHGSWVYLQQKEV